MPSSHSRPVALTSHRGAAIPDPSHRKLFSVLVYFAVASLQVPDMHRRQYSLQGSRVDNTVSSREEHCAKFSCSSGYILILPAVPGCLGDIAVAVVAATLPRSPSARLAA